MGGRCVFPGSSLGKLHKAIKQKDRKAWTGISPILALRWLGSA
jgi:hypothetical protein